MSDILHQLTIHAPAANVYAAIATIPGLQGWWTTTTVGESAVGQTVEFRFNKHTIPMRVDELAPATRVAWACQDAAGDWSRTTVTFDLTEKGGATTLLFGHRDWRETGDHFAHCNLKWATFLLSLREYVENGGGRPFPHDVQISA